MGSRRVGTTAGGLTFAVTGSGPPLLWISGFVVASNALQDYVALFSQDYECIVFDARGSGSTPPSLRPVTTRSMARDALEVLDHLGHEAAHVHGISLGGMVAQELAIRAPHRVLTLLLGSTSPGGAKAVPASLATMWSSVWGGHAPIPGAESVNWLGALQQGLAASTHDAVGRLSRIQAPTLVMHGSRDRLLPPENAKMLQRLIPGAQLRLIRDAGHFYPMNARAQAAQVALRWMAARSDVRPGRCRPHRRVGHLAQDVVSAPVRWSRARLMPARRAYRALSR